MYILHSEIEMRTFLWGDCAPHYPPATYQPTKKKKSSVFKHGIFLLHSKDVWDCTWYVFTTCCSLVRCWTSLSCVSFFCSDCVLSFSLHSSYNHNTGHKQYNAPQLTKQTHFISYRLYAFSNLFKQTDCLLSDSRWLAVQVARQEVMNQIHFLCADGLCAAMALANQPKSIQTHLNYKSDVQFFHNNKH